MPIPITPAEFFSLSYAGPHLKLVANTSGWGTRIELPGSPPARAHHLEGADEAWRALRGVAGQAVVVAL